MTNCAALAMRGLIEVVSEKAVFVAVDTLGAWCMYSVERSIGWMMFIQTVSSQSPL